MTFVPEGPKTLLIHVGKTGGESVSSVLRALAVPYSQIHVFPVESVMLKYYDTIIITLRDPIERFVSAFNFQHPSIFKKKSHKTNMGQASIDKFKRFYDCFPNISVAAKQYGEESFCGQLIKESPPWHLQMGYCFYLGGKDIRETLKSHKGVRIIRTNYLEKDLRSVLKELGSSSSRYAAGSVSIPSLNKKRNVPSLPSALSSSELKVFQYFLELNGEYELYRELLGH
jgi:hypothetical protein